MRRDEGRLDTELTGLDVIKFSSLAMNERTRKSALYRLATDDSIFKSISVFTKS